MGSMKIEKFLGKNELPAFFRQLADALEGNDAGELACAEAFHKLKVSMKDEYGQVSLRVKIKSELECVAGDVDDEVLSLATGKPSYGKLKKRMGSSFKVIFKMIHQGEIPPAAAVDEFLADSKLMVTYPGYGDPYYDEYMKACEAFAAAYKAGDMAQMNETVDVLVHQKGHCHAKYK